MTLLLALFACSPSAPASSAPAKAAVAVPDAPKPPPPPDDDTLASAFLDAGRRPNGPLACPEGTTAKTSTDSGVVTDRCVDTGGRPHGPERITRPDGSLEAHAFVHGVEHGPWGAWLADGRQLEEGRTDHGRPTGTRRSWSADGVLVLQGSYDADGQQSGAWTSWWPSGAKKDQASWTAGVQSGPETSTWPDGARRAEGSWKDGRRSGAWTWWWPTGEPAGTATFDGDAATLALTWPSGAPMATGQLVGDRRTGPWTWYGEDGAVLATSDDGALPHVDGRVLAPNAPFPGPVRELTLTALGDGAVAVKAVLGPPACGEPVDCGYPGVPAGGGVVLAVWDASAGSFADATVVDAPAASKAKCTPPEAAQAALAAFEGRLAARGLDAAPAPSTTSASAYVGGHEVRLSAAMTGEVERWGDPVLAAAMGPVAVLRATVDGAPAHAYVRAPADDATVDVAGWTSADRAVAVLHVTSSSADACEPPAETWAVLPVWAAPPPPPVDTVAAVPVEEPAEAMSAGATASGATVDPPAEAAEVPATAAP